MNYWPNSVHTELKRYVETHYLHKFMGGFCTRGRTRTGTAVKPEDFKSSMSTIPSRGHSPEHRQIVERVNPSLL
jgi:hypothetical protein